MSVRIEVCTTIPLSTDDLWAVLEPIDDHGSWMADAESIEFETEQTTGVGASFRCTTKVGPIRIDDRMTVTQWKPGAAMGIEHHGVVKGSGAFRLRPCPQGTRFCWEEVLRFPWWMGGPLGERIGAPVLRSIWRENLRRLRIHAAGGASGSRSGHPAR